MADHHNGSECRKGRKEGCWSVGSLQAPGSGQPDEDAEGWSLSRTQGGGNENQRKRRCTTGSKEEQQHQPVASQLSTSAHAQFQFSRKSKTRKHGRVLSYYWVRFPPPPLSRPILWGKRSITSGTGRTTIFQNHVCLFFLFELFRRYISRNDMLIHNSASASVNWNHLFSFLFIFFKKKCNLQMVNEEKKIKNRRGSWATALLNSFRRG